LRGECMNAALIRVISARLASRVTSEDKALRAALARLRRG
jgi:hypothetical protein